MREIPHLKETINQTKKAVEENRNEINKLNQEVKILKETIIQEHKANTDNFKVIEEAIKSVKHDLRANAEAAYIMANYLSKITKLESMMELAKYQLKKENKIGTALFQMMGTMKYLTTDIEAYGKPKTCKTTGQKLWITFTTYKSDDKTKIMEANPCERDKE